MVAVVEVSDKEETAFREWIGKRIGKIRSEAYQRLRCATTKNSGDSTLGGDVPYAPGSTEEMESTLRF